MNLLDMSLGELAEAYTDEWNAQDAAQTIADNHSKARHEIRQHIIRLMDAQGMESYKTDRVTLTLKEDLVPQVKDWTTVLPWIFENGKLELIRKQLNTGPFKEMIENGEALPEGLEAVAVKTLNNRRR